MEWMDITTMKLSRNRTGYYIKEGFSSIFAHGFMSFASVCIIIAFLVIMGSFVLLAVNIHALIGELENENIILAYVDENLSDADARALQPQILATDNVVSTQFKSREQALQEFLGKYENLDRFSGIDASVTRHRYEVFVDEIELIGETQTALSEIYGIADVNANLAVAKMLVNVRNVVSGISVVIVAVLLAISLFIMSNTTKLATFDRREEIAIMRMVGATSSFIRWPFVYQGFILGVSGSIAAFAVLWALYEAATNRLIGFLDSGILNIIPFSSVSLPIFVVFAAIGFGVGVGGSGLALNKYLKV